MSRYSHSHTTHTLLHKQSVVYFAGGVWYATGMTRIALRVLTDTSISASLREIALHSANLRVLLDPGSMGAAFHQAVQTAGVQTIRCYGTGLLSEEFWESVPEELRKRVVCEETEFERQLRGMCADISSFFYLLYVCGLIRVC